MYSITKSEDINIMLEYTSVISDDGATSTIM